MPNESWKELTIPPDGFDCQQLLAEWRWLVPETMKPLWLNTFGDWMLESPDGKIYFLDLLEGTFNCIAPSDQVVRERLEQEANRNRWLMADWFELCNERGLFLRTGQCYGWKIAPILGGKFEIQNIQVFDILVYESIMGQVQRQAKNFPEGFVITGFRIGHSNKPEK